MITFDDTLALVRQAYPCDEKSRFFDNPRNSALKTSLLSFLDTMMNTTIGRDFNRELTFDECSNLLKILLNFKKTTEEKEVSSEDCYNPLVQQANQMLSLLDNNLFLSVFTKLAQWNLFNERNFNLVKELADMDIDTVDSVLSILDLNECPCDKQWFFERIVSTSMLDYALPGKVAQLWKEDNLSRDTVENLLVNQCSRPRAKTFG